MSLLWHLSHDDVSMYALWVYHIATYVLLFELNF